jgi:hypothetical protein
MKYYSWHDLWFQQSEILYYIKTDGALSANKYNIYCTCLLNNVMTHDRKGMC